MNFVGQPFQRTQIYLRRIFAVLSPFLLALTLLSGCVASQNSNSDTNLATALSPDANKAEIAPNDSAKIEDTAEAKGSIETGDTKTALAQDSSKPAPAEAAAQKAASASKTTVTTSPAKTAKAEAPKTIFAALSASNDKSSSKRPKNAAPQKRVVVRRKGAPSTLPGVRKRSTIFGILSDDNPNEDLDEPVEVVSLPSQTRRGNFGLLLQTKSVKVHCFPRKLVRILKRVERRYGRKVMVTSGYRSRAKNRRIRGAKNSIHIRCAAADIQVRGVSKWKLARYLRSVPGRGGVGTYCHTNSVHIDIGKKRDWNWRCRRKKRRR